MTGRARLDGVHPDLVRLCEALDEALQAETAQELAVVCGHRGEREQEAAYRAGRSKARFGASAHNMTPSMAVDVAPMKGLTAIDWDVKGSAWRALLRLAREVAWKEGINVDWRRSMFSGDEGHIELAGWRGRR